MYEQRRSRRVPIHLTLKISSLFKQDNVQVKNLNAEIEVKDISRTGLGFISTSILPIGYFFNAKLDFGETDQALYCVVKIIRSHEIGDGKINYGCQFIGMASIFSDIFDELEHKADGM
jgi:hypothetical protein